MCISMATLAMISAGVSAAGTVMQGMQANQMGKYQQAQADADARAQESEGRLMAEKIRKAGRRQASEAIAAQAGAGVSLNDPGAMEINRRIVGDYEEDAIAEILGGGYRAASRRAEGLAAAASGRAQRTNALLGAAATGFSGWRSSRRSVVFRDPGEPSAPIESRT
jgi:hypothetical protein